MNTMVYFTVTGMFELESTDFIKPGMDVVIEKEPDNEHDAEAIMVKMEGLGKIGYVANSPKTVVGKSYSAGRLYDKFSDKAVASVKYNMGSTLLCEITV